MHVTYNPFLCRVIDRLVTGVFIVDANVAAPFVRVDGFRFFRDRAVHEVVKRVFPSVRDDCEADAAAALDGARYPSLVAFVGSPLALRLAADQRFVDFDHAEESGPVERIIAHRFTNPMAKIPRRTVRDTKGALHLRRRNTFL